jgi:large subunit ribosomal protein L29
MKNAEIKALSTAELAAKILAGKDVLSKLKFAHAITPIENPMKIREARKLVARLSTEIASR